MKRQQYANSPGSIGVLSKSGEKLLFSSADLEFIEDPPETIHIGETFDREICTEIYERWPQVNSKTRLSHILYGASVITNVTKIRVVLPLEKIGNYFMAYSPADDTLYYSEK